MGIYYPKMNTNLLLQILKNINKSKFMSISMIRTKI
jgi:hypothetical protein